MRAWPRVPEGTAIVPRPLVGDGLTEYVALKAAPETGPLGVPISSAPVILPVGLAPSAANSPEKTATLKLTGLVAYPAYVPFRAPLVNDVAASGSPVPNKTFTSETKRKL